MDQVVQALTQHEWLSWAWRLVVWACVAYLLALGLMFFLRPSAVFRFFEGFASSARITPLDAVLRSIIGLAAMRRSRVLKFPCPPFGSGALLAGSGLPLRFCH